MNIFALNECCVCVSVFSKDTACKERVHHGQGKPELSAIKWNGTVYRGCPAPRRIVAHVAKQLTVHVAD